MSPILRKLHTPALLCLAALGACLALAACGGSANAGSNSEQSTEQKEEVKFADFAKCLREHGVHAEVASMPGGGHGLKIGPGPGAAKGSESGRSTMEAAQKACARYRPTPKRVNLSPQQKVELEEHVQRFAKCMREHGVEIHTSTAGGGVQLSIHRRAGGPGSGGPNPESPAFQQAQTACQKLMPRPPGGGRFGGGQKFGR